MSPIVRGALLCSAVLSVGLGATVDDDIPAAHASPVQDSTVSFEAQIAPMFEARCVRCHGGMDEGLQRLEAQLNLTTYEGLMAGSEFGAVVEPGDPAESIIIEMIEAGDMPEEGDPVTPEELELLRRWITEGAKKN